jgi:hypothetical protein
MANTDRSANDNQVTPVTTGLGENSNVATDSGNAGTKPAATAVEPGHNTPNPARSNQLPSGPASQSHHQGHNQQSQHSSYPYNHPYYNNPYYMNYISQFRGYDGQQQSYGSFGRNTYGQPYRYGMSPQTSYNQHSASPANVGGFGGGASANERGTNNHPYHNNPYYMNYISQFGGYSGQPQGYGSFGRSMYGQPHHYGMSPPTSYGQHASPANVGGFGGASANERGTNYGGHSTNTHSANTHSTNTQSTSTHSTNTHSTNTHSTNTHSTNTRSTNTHSTNTRSANTHSANTHPANTSNGGHSTNNRGYPSGPQGFQMYHGQILPGSGTYHDFRCLILLI